MQRRGFTLIELLVAVAIIGFLSAIVLASLSVSRTKSENAGMVQQVEQYIAALQLTYNIEDPAVGKIAGEFPSVPAITHCGGGAPCWKTSSTPAPPLPNNSFRAAYLYCLVDTQAGSGCTYQGNSGTNSIVSQGAFDGEETFYNMISAVRIEPTFTWQSSSGQWSMESVMYTSSGDQFALFYPMKGEFASDDECRLQDARIFRTGAPNYTGMTICVYESR